MTVTEIVDQLRATRPSASDALRLQVLTLASAPPTPAPPSFLERVRSRRRLVLALPAAAALAVVSAVAIGVSRSDPVAREATTPPGAVESSSGSADRTTLAGPASDTAASTAQKAAPGPVAGRAQRYSATLTIGVEDAEALSEATQQALAIARDLGGYLVSVNYATGEDGAASVMLKVPSSRASEAVTRLSGLGTILGQSVQIQDLQESLDGLDRELERLRAQVAALTVAIERAETAAERARLLERRAQAQAQMRELRASRTATAAEGRTATIQLELRTAEGSGVAPGSRLDRALDKALEVLAWEALAVLVVGIALAPLALVAAALWGGRRVARRRQEERLLGAS